MITFASVVSNTNQIISKADDDWSFVKNGCFARFSSDESFYQISGKEKIILAKQFSKTGIKQIEVEENCIPFLNVDDSLFVYFKKYYLNTIFSISNKGKNYKVGDIVNIKGGSPFMDVSSGIPNLACVTVSSVDLNGGILGISLRSQGEYFSIPESQESKFSSFGGFGEGAIFEAEFVESPNRGKFEKTIQHISFKDNKTFITFDSKLPDGLKIGNLNAEKWVLYLSVNYIGDSKVCQRFEIIKDFTPNYCLPILPKNTLSGELAYNQTLIFLDAKIKELSSRIEELESK